MNHKRKKNSEKQLKRRTRHGTWTEAKFDRDKQIEKLFVQEFNTHVVESGKTPF